MASYRKLFKMIPKDDIEGRYMARDEKRENCYINRVLLIRKGK